MTQTAAKIKTITLTCGLSATVDADDYDWLNQWKWRATARKDSWRYALRSVGPRSAKTVVIMHRLITGAGPSQQVDHINGNTLDNRRSNLRIVDPSGNQANRRKRHGRTSSTYKGVGWHKGLSKWQARIRVRGRRLHLGVFALEEQAARAYDEAATRHFGDLALLNYPQRGDG